jgi:mannose-6-phosphate isomerase-like protein (cupin superfamily)
MPIHRRAFLRSAASVIPAAALQNVLAQSSLETQSSTPNPVPAGPVPAGADRTGHLHSIGFSSLAFKVIPSDTAGGLLVIEHRNLTPDTGPALHLHLSQEEWFYVMEGEVRFQVGERRMRLGPGESILAPRRIAHTFSASGSPAQMLIAFTPADKMEQYFIDAAAQPSLAATADFMNRYDMQWVGPSPFWKA